MPDAGLLLLCAGCCCGHPTRGGAMAPQRVMKSLVRRAYESSGLPGRVRLAFTECLGPCSEANVALLFVDGRPLWFRRMNSPDLLAELLHYTRAMIDGGARLPSPLAARSFSWTGGGVGPEPPVEKEAER